MALLRVLAYIILAPLAGGLLAGFDRKLTARMQGRVGPPLLQPFYDVGKLFEKENIVVRKSQNFYINFFFVFVIFSGAIFFAGGDLLLAIFALTLAGIFFVLGGCKASSPYSFIGAQRELLQIVSYEPMVMIAAVGMYMVTKSFAVADIARFHVSLIWYLPGVFAGFLFILTTKLRKSPFDLSTSHHGHQEIVKGITTEFSGSTLALIEISHWYENVFILGIVYLFFAANPVAAMLAVLISYVLEVIIDNTYARAKWQVMLSASWIISIVLGVGNIMILSLWAK